MSDYQMPEGYKQTEVGIIPNDWCVSTLGRHASFKVIAQLPPKRYAKKEERS